MADILQAAWRPDDETIRNANLTAVMRELGVDDYADLHRWSVDDRSAFWKMVLDRLGIVFDVLPDQILVGTPREPTWLPGARMNIVASCFTAPEDKIAVVYRREGSNQRTSYGELRNLVDRFAAGLTNHGVAAGDRVAIAMPMTIESVVAYLGIAAAGATVVSVADSFAPHEIATRLAIAARLSFDHEIPVVRLWGLERLTIT